jgi:hypothetical protein
MTEYDRSSESENAVENVMAAYLFKGQSIKWVGSMLEIHCSNNVLTKNQEMLKKEILRIIEKYGKNHESELKAEMKRRGKI